MHIPAFHWCKILKEKPGGPLIISQTAGWCIRCTRDHQRGCFDWRTKVINIYDVSLTSSHITAFHSCRILSKKHGGHLIISQAAGWSIQCTGDHWRGCFYWHAEIRHIYDALLDSCISQLSIDVGYSRRSLVVPLSYHKQLDGPFNAPEIIRGATLTDTLRLHIYTVWYTDGILLIIAFHWCKIFKQKLGGPLIISQAARWTIQCIRDHWGAALTDVLMLQIYLMYCCNPAYYSSPVM